MTPSRSTWGSSRSSPSERSRRSIGTCPLAELSGRGQGASARRRVVIVADLAAAPDLRRQGDRRARVGHRRQRVRRLPQRLRRDGHGPCASEDRRGRAGTRRARHAFRSADRGRPARRRAAHRAHRSAVLAIRKLGHRGDAGRGPDHAGDHWARPDRQDRGHVPRAPRCADGQRLPAPGQSRAARTSGTPCRRRPG